MAARSEAALALDCSKREEGAGSMVDLIDTAVVVALDCSKKENCAVSVLNH